MTSWTTSFASLVIAGAMVAGVASDASAETARHLYNKGHGYRTQGGGYAYGYNRRRSYGPGPAVGAAIAGTALGIAGLAAGAAAANRYDDGYDAPVYGGPAYGGGYVYAPSGGYVPDEEEPF